MKIHKSIPSPKLRNIHGFAYIPFSQNENNRPCRWNRVILRKRNSKHTISNIPSAENQVSLFPNTASPPRNDDIPTHTRRPPSLTMANTRKLDPHSEPLVILSPYTVRASCQIRRDRLILQIPDNLWPRGRPADRTAATSPSSPACLPGHRCERWFFDISRRPGEQFPPKPS